MRITKIIKLLFEITYLGAVVLTPIYFAVFLKNNNVFELNKLILFKILTLILTFLFIVLVILKPHKYIYKIKSLWKHHKGSLVFISLVFLFFLISLLLSVVFSIDPIRSLFGSYSRQQGLFSSLYYIVFFVILFLWLDNKKQIQRIVYTISFSSCFVCLYGLIQYFGLDPFHWIESTQMRLTSTMGQPNILAAYLLLVMPISIYFLFRAKNIFLKVFFLCLILLQFFCFIQTNSMASILAFVGAVLVVSGFVLLQRYRKPVEGVEGTKSLKALRDLVPSTVLIVLIFVFIGGAFFTIKQSPILKMKLDSLLNLGGGSVSVRFDLYRAGLDAFFDKPFLGYGLESQADILAGYYGRDWAVHSNVNVMPDRAHNIFLDILLTRGVVGLFAYLALIFIFLVSIFKNIKKRREVALNYALLFSIPAYLFYLLFNFSFVVGEIYFWLFFAIIMWIRFSSKYNEALYYVSQEKKNNFDSNFVISNDSEKSLKHDLPTILQHKFLPNISQIIIKTLLVIVFGIIFSFSIINQSKTLIADFYFREFQVAMHENLFFKALENKLYLEELNIRDDYYEKEMAFNIANIMPNLRESGKVFWLTAENVLKEILNGQTWQSFSDRYKKAVVLSALVTDPDSEYFREAEYVFDNLIEYSPEMPMIYLGLARLNFNRGEYEQAIDDYGNLLVNLPSLSRTDMNREHRAKVKNQMYISYVGIGGNLVKLEKYDEAIESYSLALNISGDDFGVLQKISDVYLEQEDFEQLIAYNTEIWQKYPYYYEWPQNIARAYEEQGDVESAEKYGRIVRMLGYEIEL